MHPQWIWVTYVSGRADRTGVCGTFYCRSGRNADSISAVNYGGGYQSGEKDYLYEPGTGNVCARGGSHHSGDGMQGTSERCPEYSGVSSGGNLFCRNRTALRQHRGTDAR